VERVVVALGGNALLRRGAEDTYEEMYRAARAAAERVAQIATDGWEVVVTHGNGPQVGRILIQQDAAANGATYVDTFTSSIGHDACKLPGVAWVNGIVPNSVAFPLHPNQMGEQNMANQVLSALG